MLVVSDSLVFLERNLLIQLLACILFLAQPNVLEQSFSSFRLTSSFVIERLISIISINMLPYRHVAHSLMIVLIYFSLTYPT